MSMEITWKKLTLEDKELIEGYFAYEQLGNCEACFANNYLWDPFYKLAYSVIDGFLVFLVEDSRLSMAFPLATREYEPEALRNVILVMEDFFAEKQEKFRIHLVSHKQFELLESLFPGKYEAVFDRDIADYVYETEKMISLAGKKLHGKRNHINKFKENFPDWRYEALSGENADACRQMAEEWKAINLCDEKDEKHKEFCVTLRALKHFQELDLKGGVLWAGERVVAFTLGEKLNDTTFVVHIEKAFADVQGAYPMINQQFLLHEASAFTYVNREEDAGSEGLRKAKSSYHPAFLEEKGVVTHADGA